MNMESQKALIEKYKEIIKEDGNEHELFKWRLIKSFKEKWDIDAPDFAGMIQSIEFEPILDHRSRTFIKFADEYSEEAREAFRMLFDEETDLDKRISDFKAIAQELVKREHPTLNAFQDERSAATYLTFRFPEIYTIYKNSFYTAYVDLLGLKKKRPGEKYTHYLTLIDDFVENYILKDEELIKLSRNTLDDDCYVDSKLNILAQDILYRTLEQDSDTEQEEKDFIETLEALGFEDTCSYLELASDLINDLDLAENDDRVYFSVRGDNKTLNLVFGQRYCLSVSAKGPQNYGFVLSERDSSVDYQKPYKGEPKAYWHKTDEFSVVKSRYEKIKTACREELKRTTKSGYIVFTNKVFSKAVFDPEYRLKLYSDIFDQHPEIQESTKPYEPTSKMMLNQILFGPPGTGKTYSTINKAVELIKPDFDFNQGREAITSEFKDLIEKGRIVFTTFHQSMGYEDFVEGIKPVLSDDEGDEEKITYKVQDGIFKDLALKARMEENNFDEKIEWLKSKCDESNSDNEPLRINTGNSEFDVTYRGGRTFRIKPKKSARKDSDYPASIENIRKVYEGATRKEVYNPTYVTGILEYLYQNGLKRFQEKTGSNNEPYVLIIDEINRGNVSQIFGELITLIEDDKRIGGKEELRAVLPYSKEEFGVPSNVYIIGTMNTADRSVEALDAALRRRFNFIEMPPKPSLIREYGMLSEKDGKINGIDLVNLLETINRRLLKLLDKDHLIGHSYFINVQSLNDLKNAFHYKINPLLQEYFYGDFGKIGLVLGSGFISVNKGNESESSFFAEFDISELHDYADRVIYEIKNVSLMSEDEFLDAVEKLLN